jgi:hypothetical protein
MHTESIGRLYRPKRKQHALCPIMKMSVNGVSTILSPCIMVDQSAMWLLMAIYKVVTGFKA